MAELTAYNPANTWLHYEYCFDPQAQDPIWYPSEVDVSSWLVEDTNTYIATLKADPKARNVYTFIKDPNAGNGTSSSGWGCIIPVVLGVALAAAAAIGIIVLVI